MEIKQGRIMKYIIIGTGNISNTYVKVLSELPTSELVGCVSRSGKKLAIASHVPSWTALELVSVDFDAVIVTTPNGMHSAGIEAAAKLGKHVICEKPLGISVPDMERTLELCSKKKITLAIAYQRRTAPDNLSVKQLLEKGSLGEVFAADLSAKFYRDQAYYDSSAYRGGYDIDGGGPFMQQACHNIDIYTWFFGKPLEVVSMLDTFSHQIEVEDHGAALLKYPKMIGTIIASTATRPGFAARLEVHTSKGSFTMVDDVITQWHFDNIPNPTDQQYNYKHDGASSASVSDTSAHKKIIVDFEKAVATGSEPIASGKSAKETSEVILEIYRKNSLKVGS